MAIYGDSEEELALQKDERGAPRRGRRRRRQAGVGNAPESSRPTEFADAAIKRQINRAADLRAPDVSRPAAGSALAKMFTGVQVAKGLEVKMGMRGKGGLVLLTRRF